MAPMSEEQWKAFLLEGTRTAKLATVRRDGSPHVAPVWFTLDGDGRIVFNTGAGTAKGKALRRDPRVSLCVHDDVAPFSFVLIDGVAQISEEPDELLHWATVIAGRYMGADQAERYGRRNAVPGELLVKVAIRRVVAEAGVAD
jgi:PPOX class probable F420-dependent enzyme